MPNINMKPQKNKARIKNENLINSKRKQLKKDTGIFREKTGGVTVDNIHQSLVRWEKRKGHSIHSFDTVLRNLKSTDVAVRFVAKDLLRGVKNKHKLTPKQEHIITSLIDYRSHTFPRTNIQVRPAREFLMMELINRLGENKTKQVFDEIKQRSIALQRLAKVSNTKNKTLSDAYFNVGSRVGIPSVEMEIFLMDRTELSKRVENFIEERKHQINQVQKAELPPKSKEQIEKILTGQIKNANFENKKFKLKYQIHL